MSDKNIMSLFHKKVKKLAIIMDEIDGMNNGDKGGINTLIKLIRPKKTKKQKMEEITMIPIICIGNYRVDKKMKELMKVCNVIELKTPSLPEMMKIINTLFPVIKRDMKEKIANYIQGDLRKLNKLHQVYVNKPEIFTDNSIDNIFQMKYYNDDTKKIIHKLMNRKYELKDHNKLMNETERTSAGLLWHENIIDMLHKIEKKKAISFYIEQLENICFADYIDRITFQKQIWQFNEMSSLLKTFKNQKLYHDSCLRPPSLTPQKIASSDVRFTKVLTKYSTEYNNYIFIQDLCQQLGMDKKDLFGFFIDIKNRYTDAEILSLFENVEVSKLDIHRMYRYLEKYIKENAVNCEEKEVELETELEVEYEVECEI
jgi:hypothetical protein